MGEVNNRGSFLHRALHASVCRQGIDLGKLTQDEFETMSTTDRVNKAVQLRPHLFASKDNPCEAALSHAFHYPHEEGEPEELEKILGIYGEDTMTTFNAPVSKNKTKAYRMSTAELLLLAAFLGCNMDVEDTGQSSPWAALARKIGEILHMSPKEQPTGVRLRKLLSDKGYLYCPLHVLSNPSTDAATQQQTAGHQDGPVDGAEVPIQGDQHGEQDDRQPQQDSYIEPGDIIPAGDTVAGGNVGAGSGIGKRRGRPPKSTTEQAQKRQRTDSQADSRLETGTYRVSERRVQRLDYAKLSGGKMVEKISGGGVKQHQQNASEVDLQAGSSRGTASEKLKIYGNGGIIGDCLPLPPGFQFHNKPIPQGMVLASQVNIFQPEHLDLVDGCVWRDDSSERNGSLKLVKECGGELGAHIILIPAQFLRQGLPSHSQPQNTPSALPTETGSMAAAGQQRLMDAESPQRTPLGQVVLQPDGTDALTVQQFFRMDGNFDDPHRYPVDSVQEIIDSGDKQLMAAALRVLERDYRELLALVGKKRRAASDLRGQLGEVLDSVDNMSTLMHEVLKSFTVQDSEAFCLEESTQQLLGDLPPHADAEAPAWSIVDLERVRGKSMLQDEEVEVLKFQFSFQDEPGTEPVVGTYFLRRQLKNIMGGVSDAVVNVLKRTVKNKKFSYHSVTWRELEVALQRCVGEETENYLHMIKERGSSQGGVGKVASFISVNAVGPLVEQALKKHMQERANDLGEDDTSIDLLPYFNSVRWAFVYEPNQVATPAIRYPDHEDGTTAGDGTLLFDSELPGYDELPHADMDGGGAEPSSFL